MVRTTRLQRVALKRVFDRAAVYEDKDCLITPPLTYRQFRKRRVHGGSGCIMVWWNSMWLGIEPDGYTHS